jgi:hypothetical protein
MGAGPSVPWAAGPSKTIQIPTPMSASPLPPGRASVLRPSQVVEGPMNGGGGAAGAPGHPFYLGRGPRGSVAPASVSASASGGGSNAYGAGSQGYYRLATTPEGEEGGEGDEGGQEAASGGPRQRRRRGSGGSSGDESSPEVASAEAGRPRGGARPGGDEEMAGGGGWCATGSGSGSGSDSGSEGYDAGGVLHGSMGTAAHHGGASLATAVSRFRGGTAAAAAAAGADGAAAKRRWRPRRAFEGMGEGGGEGGGEDEAMAEGAPVAAR